MVIYLIVTPDDIKSKFIMKRYKENHLWLISYEEKQIRQSRQLESVDTRSSKELEVGLIRYLDMIVVRHFNWFPENEQNRHIKSGHQIE